MSNVNPDVKSLFFEAIDQKTPEELRGFLDRACTNDVNLRAQLEQLLQAHRDAGKFLGGATPVTIDHPPLEQPGTQIGPYKLLEQIGEGGMGVVYVASQKEPLRRKVALKIIKPGMDTREVVARFEAERQALALMDHPNIAKVFDAGATDAGRPYFAMELVKGTPITEYCDREQLTMRERLALFVTLCHGVQHAHQKGVIHRDLKPSNLLIEVHDVRPVPKIIDFGIAKAVGQQLTEKTFYTAQSQMVGTPLYMSPEQAGQSAVDVDTRSDIYSLGVLLYELLTGHTPFEKDTLRTAGFDEMRRIIREVEPPRPSARVSTLQAADLSTISERRHIEPGKLSSQLRGELDWIVMKAMDKDRNRRYATVNDLAADVERYLHDEPVQACPPSTAYRFTKFARRNQAALVTGALVALALITGTGVSIWQAIRATNAEQAAITERDEKEQQALRATRAERQTAQVLLTAQERLQFGRQAVDDMYTQFAEKWLAPQTELTQVQKQFLEKALAFYQRLATEEGDDPTVLFEAARAEHRVGDIQDKFEHHAEAETAHRRAIELLTQLPREADESAKYTQELARVRRCLGRLLCFTGRPQEAEQEQRLALDLFRALNASSSDGAQYQFDLALSYFELGNVLVTTGKFSEAEEAYRQNLALFESLLKRAPDDPNLKYQQAHCQSRLAQIMEKRSLVEAENIYRSIASRAAELVTVNPGHVDYRSFQADILVEWGGVLSRLGHTPEAEGVLRQAVATKEGLVRDIPGHPVYQDLLAGALCNLGIVLGQLGKSEESEQVERRSLEIREKLASEHPQVPGYQSQIGAVLNNMAFKLKGREKWEEARQLLERAVVHQRAALDMNPRNGVYQTFLRYHLMHLTEVQLALGDPAAAARTANDYAQHLHAQDRPLTCVILDCLEVFNDTDAANLLFKAVIREAIQRAGDDPNQYMLADLLTTAPEPLRDPDLALRLARRAVELEPGDGIRQQSLGWALYRTGDLQGAVEALRKTSSGGENDFVFAMALWQLGEKTEARTHFDSGSEWLIGYEQRCEEGAQQGMVKFPLPVQLKRLQAEAAALLGVTPPTVEPAPEPAAKVGEAQELPKTTPAPDAAKAEETPQ